MKERVTAKEWFDQGDHFHYTALRLHMEPHQLQFIYAIPGIVLKAFAAECYLKCLLELEGQHVPPIHNLLKLFDKLSATSRRSITARWDKESRPYLASMHKGAEKGLRVPKNMRDALDQSSTAFIDWRYKTAGSRPHFTMMAFPHCTRCCILESKPDWAHEEPNPLAWLNPAPEFVEPKSERFGYRAIVPPVFNRQPATFDARTGGTTNPKDGGPDKKR